MKTKKTKTRIITAQITIVESMPEKSALTHDGKTKKETMDHVGQSIKELLKVDDVKVSNVQDFILGK